MTKKKTPTSMDLLNKFLEACKQPDVRIEYMKDTLRGWQVTTLDKMPIRFGQYRYKVFAPVARKFYKTEIGRYDKYVQKDTGVVYEAESVTETSVYIKSLDGLKRAHIDFKTLLEKYNMISGEPAGVCEMRCVAQY